MEGGMSLAKKRYNPYEKYGVRRVVNAATTLTRLGGSIPAPEVYAAMEDASMSFVQIPELQQWAGRAIAEATGAEAGLPTAGSSNAITLAAAACMMKGTELEKYDPLELESWTHVAKRLPMHTEGLRTEFIVQKSNRNIYDHAVECAGGRLKEVGSEAGTTEEELDKAYEPKKTAAYYYTVRSSKKSQPLETVIRIAHRHRVPVIVDAAAELPPKKNLKRYIALGSDLVVFSGGKHVSGPNNSGILAGRKDLIKLAHLQAYPFHGVGRAAKMSRETIVGFVTALRLYAEHDEEAMMKAWEKRVRRVAEQLVKIPGVEAKVAQQTTVDTGEVMTPLCAVKIDEKAFGITGEDLSKTLRDGDPSIEVPYEPHFLIEDCDGMLIINPEFLDDEEEQLVIQRIKEILTQKREQTKAPKKK